MKKMLKNLRGNFLLLLFCLVFTNIALAKVHISGNFQVWFDSRTSNNYNKRSQTYVGNMDDESFEEKAFVINKVGYSFLRDYYGNKFLLRVRFDSRGNVIQEDIFETKKFTVNCLGIRGNNSFCFTISPQGRPALWDRYRSRYLSYGEFVNVTIRNPYRYRNNDDEDFFGNLFEF